MKQLPRALADAVQAGQASEPLALLAVWAERGPESRLVAPNQLAGSNDPAAANDANVTVTNGALVLAAGNTVPMDPANALGSAYLETKWQGHVTEVGQEVWA